jgi:HlyD family secretion protein
LQPGALKAQQTGSAENGNGATVAVAPNARVAKVTRGDLLLKLSAAGTVKPEETVEVVSQLTGMIRAMGKNPTDPGKPLESGSAVHKGDALAYLDATIYQSQVEIAVASLATAKANLMQYEARHAQALRELKRAQSLLPNNAIAVSEYEQAVTGLQVAAATIDAGRASVQQCEASLQIAQANLDYTVIKSPTDGVIIERRVDTGQVVLANSPTTPGLFLIAKDPQQLQVWATIKETEINRIQVGMPVQFTVDGRPGDVFDGKVAQVRLSTTKNGNAGDYTIVHNVGIHVDNPNGLLPYLTANFQFEFDQSRNVLLVSNDALREPLQSAPAASQPGGIASRAPANSNGTGDSAGHNQSAGTLRRHKSFRSSAQNMGKAWRRLFIKSGNLFRPVEVQVGRSNGVMTEVLGDNVKEGMEVVLGALPQSGGG